MSIIRAIQAQLGLSVTPANNFTLDASADNGTMKLARGNAGATTQDILTVDATGVLTAPQGIVTNRLILSSEQAASGTFVDFPNLPSWVKRVTVSLREISTNGSSPIIVQVGDSGGLNPSGYLYTVSSSGGTVSSYTTGFGICVPVAASVTGGHLFLTLCSPSLNGWVGSSSVKIATNALFYGAGSKNLSSVMDRIRVTTMNNTDVFDSGIISILYEG